MSKNYILVLLNVQGRAMLASTRVFGSLIDVLWLWLTMWTATAGVVRARRGFAASWVTRAAHGLTLRLCRWCSKLCKKAALPSNAARQFFVRILDQGYIFLRRTQNTKYAPARCRPECSRGERAPRAASYKSRTPSKAWPCPWFSALHAASCPALVQRIPNYPCRALCR